LMVKTGAVERLAVTCAGGFCATRAVLVKVMFAAGIGSASVKSSDPPVVRMTSNFTVQVAFAAMVRPAPVTTVLPPLGVTLPPPPHPVNVGVNPGKYCIESATAVVDVWGKLSVKVPALSALALPLLSVSVASTGVFRGALPAEKLKAAVSALLEIVSVALALPEAAMVCVFVRFAAGMVFVRLPDAPNAASTVTVVVHVLAAIAVPSVVVAGIVAIPIVIVPVPAPESVGEVHPALNTVAGTASRVMFAGIVSLKPTFVSADVCVFPIVTVIRDVPPATIVDGAKLFVKLARPFTNCDLLVTATPVLVTP